MSVTEMIDTLRQLQTVDDGIKAVEDELDLLPRNLEAAREDREAVRERLDAAETALEAVLKRRRELEQEIQAAEANVIKYETQKIKVKTNEEYQALNTQIAHEKDKKSELEDRVLETFDQEEAAADRKKKMKAELAQVTEAVAAREEELKARSEEDRERLDVLRRRREEILPTVEPHLLNRYEAIRARKSGTAVVTIIRGACGGCFTQQPPQKVNEVRKSDALQTCEFCGRFLVWDPEEAAAS